MNAADQVTKLRLKYFDKVLDYKKQNISLSPDKMSLLVKSGRTVF